MSLARAREHSTRCVVDVSFICLIGNNENEHMIYSTNTSTPSCSPGPGRPAQEASLACAVPKNDCVTCLFLIK